MHACSIIEVAREEMAKGEAKGEEDSRGERGEIWGALFKQDLLGVLTT
jgi:hypothetical protein